MTDQLSADLASLRIHRDEGPRPPSRLPRVLAILAVVGALGAGGAVALPHLKAQIFKTEISVTEISMVSPVQASVSVTSTGYVVAQTVSKVGAKVPGRVAKVHVREGSVVHAGDPLIELDDADQKTAIAASTSRVVVARARPSAASPGARCSKISPPARGRSRSRPRPPRPKPPQPPPRSRPCASRCAIGSSPHPSTAPW